MAEVIIRQAVPGDAEGIYEIEKLCFPDPWSMDALTFELEGNPRAFYVVAELDGRVVGCRALDHRRRRSHNECRSETRLQEQEDRRRHNRRDDRFHFR